MRSDLSLDFKSHLIFTQVRFKKDHTKASPGCIHIKKSEMRALTLQQTFKGLFLAVPWGCLQFVIVIFPDHTHLLFLKPHLLLAHERFKNDYANFSSECIHRIWSKMRALTL